MNIDRAAILDDAIAKASAVGWRLSLRMDNRAELATSDGRERLFVEVQPDGTIRQEQQASPQDSAASLSHPTWRTWLRNVGGIGAILILLGILASTSSDIGQAEAAKASAIQITQIYAGSIFYAVIAMGICVALYVLSRAGE